MIEITENLSAARGYFGIEVRSSNGERISEKSREFTQVFTDYAFKLIHGSTNTIMGNSYNYGIFRYCKVGSGTVERGVTDVGLHIPMSTPVAPASNGNYAAVTGGLEVHGGKNYYKMTRQYFFNLGAVVGTIREVGLFFNNDNTSLVAGQLIKDELGIPTPITLLVDEQLIITYTVYMETPRTIRGDYTNIAEFANGTVDVNGITYAYSCNFSHNMYNVAYLDASIGMHGSLTPFTNNPYMGINNTYSSDTAKAKCSYSAVVYANRIEKFFSITVYPAFGSTTINNLVFPTKNEGGYLYSSGAYVIFTPGIPKSNLQTLEVSFKHTTKWREL